MLILGTAGIMAMSTPVFGSGNANDPNNSLGFSSSKPKITLDEEITALEMRKEENRRIKNSNGAPIEFILDSSKSKRTNAYSILKTNEELCRAIDEAKGNGIPPLTLNETLNWLDKKLVPTGISKFKAWYDKNGKCVYVDNSSLITPKKVVSRTLPTKTIIKVPKIPIKKITPPQKTIIYKVEPEKPKKKILNDLSYQFPVDNNMEFEMVNLEKGNDGKLTGRTLVKYNGKKEVKIYNSNEFLKFMMSKFDTTKFRCKNNIYGGLITVLDNKDNVDGAKEFLKYAATVMNQKGLTPQEVNNLSCLIDVVSFNNLLSDEINAKLNSKGILEYNNEEFLKLQESYKKLGLKSSLLGKITQFTSPIGILNYIFSGFSFDMTNNTTNHYSLNFAPNKYLLNQFSKSNDKKLEKLLKIVEKQEEANKLTYAAALNMGN